MAKSENQKLKILYLLDILKTYTDAEKGITMQQIISRLSDFGITCERKSIYNDIFLLREIYGADIECFKNGKVTEYCLVSRDFELPELKLLVDAVSASKFITHRKSDQLIKKIENLTSKRLAKNLHSQVFVTNRIKTMNETIYYNVDAVNEAIADGKKIAFKYFEWVPSGEKRLRRDGENYIVSPCALCWDDENYYLVALENGVIKHYRVDKMQGIVCLDEKREVAENFDAAVYSKSLFGMYGGRREKVTLKCDNSIVGAVFDRFGKDIMTIPDKNSFSTTVDVVISPQFFAWVSGFGKSIHITSPESVVSEFKNHIREICTLY